MRTLVFVALGALASIGCTSSVSDTGPSQANPLDAEESAAITALKNLRASKGLPDVRPCFALDVSAAAHADDMRNRMYLSDTSPDGTTVRSCGCDAGYAPACGSSAGIAEVVSSGVEMGDAVIQQWENDHTTAPVLENTSLIVVGIGRSLGSDTPVWSMDLASIDDPSCDGVE